MTITKRKRIASRRPGPTTEDVVLIWTAWRDEAGMRWAVCGENCPVCGKSLRGSPLFPPPGFEEYDPVDMIYCLKCGSRFRVRKLGEESL